MARATVELVDALRITVERLRSDATYQWGNMGECNCGHLAQTITKLARKEIHARALERVGDWEQQAHDYCPNSGYRIDDIITVMLDHGMSIHDIGHLENLSDPAVLAWLSEESSTRPRYLRRNCREDVILYMSTWADMLAEQLPWAPCVSAA